MRILGPQKRDELLKDVGAIRLEEGGARTRRVGGEKRLLSAYCTMVRRRIIIIIAGRSEFRASPAMLKGTGGAQGLRY